MYKIPSFQINHLDLKPGIYLSQKMLITEFDQVITFDIRVCEPYVDKPMSPAVSHTIEHIGATFLRQNWNDIVYFGPMGCLTGFYVIVHNRLLSSSVPPTIPMVYYRIVELFKKVLQTTEIPGATKEECGNYELVDLVGAKNYAARYLKILLDDRDKYYGKNRYSYKTS